MKQEELERLEKFIALFDAPADGERNAAFAAANRLLKASGTTWRELIVRPRPKPIQIACDCEDCCRVVVKAMEEHAGFNDLKEQHRNFIRSIGRKWKDRPLTEKQRGYIMSLAVEMGIPTKRKAA